MAYPPPPGTSSLPPRPPANAGHSNNAGRSGFKPAFVPTSKAPGHTYASGPSYNAIASGYPGSSTATQYGQPAYSSYPGAPSADVSGAVRGYGNKPTPQQGYGPQSYSQGPTSYSAAPQIRNPFPIPGQQAAIVSNPSDYDPDMAAQIAQWQSAYSSEAPAQAVDKNGKPITPDIPKPDVPVTTVPGQPDKKKTVVRQGGGKKWTDDSLLEWDPAHLRLFVGNLAGETTDDSLLKAFAPWKSVQKARVIRDKRTNKSKGYGFVSFSDADDFFNAAKTMNGQYIQSHPVIVKKANTEIKSTNVKEKRGGKNNRNNNRKKSGNQQGGGGGGYTGASDTYGTYEPSLGPVAPTGVTKPGQKTKNGLRLLG
ncbi:hypothetical protein ED733_004951 [Metarhizium rileyi]|uniref:RRM domain-containing protein n=1 Tax=Metarhizium rileyi (strain RCEF 4871) TaxID=1649241 RepID=A0A5C6GN01_METRR|nr:hypothetical protein ED733_004951 [Metarhizium rileyi]